MKRTDADSWDLASSVGATATMVAAARALASREDGAIIDDPFAEPLVRAVGIDFFIKLAHRIGVFVVVEGIETEAEALTCLERGADLVQGFYFAHPQPPVRTCCPCGHHEEQESAGISRRGFLGAGAMGGLAVEDLADGARPASRRWSLKPSRRFWAWAMEAALAFSVRRQASMYGPISHAHTVPWW